MHIRLLTVLLFLLGLSTAPARAAEEIPLWPNGAPGSEGQTAPEVLTVTNGVPRTSSIHNPSIAAHLPSKETATGASVIILPGGGHRYLSIENEGHAFARWLSQHGVAGIVLKYRLARDTDSPYKVDQHGHMDAQRAVRMVRSRAKQWNLDPERVGLIGFSAGGELVKHASVRFDAGNPQSADPVEREGSRPGFQAYMYAGFPALDAPVPKDTPPAWVCVAFDDRPKVKPALDYFQKLRDAGINVELHIYSKGGHGFGMRDRPFPITNWPTRLIEWMGDQGLLKTSPSSAQ